jgi:hypothetical protein
MTEYSERITVTVEDITYSSASVSMGTEITVDAGYMAPYLSGEVTQAEIASLFSGYAPS